MRLSKWPGVMVVLFGMLAGTGYEQYSVQTAVLLNRENAIDLQMQPDDAGGDVVFSTCYESQVLHTTPAHRSVCIKSGGSNSPNFVLAENVYIYAKIIC